MEGRKRRGRKRWVDSFFFFFLGGICIILSYFLYFFLVIWRVTSFDELQLFIHFDIIFVEFLFFTTRPKTPIGEW